MKKSRYCISLLLNILIFLMTSFATIVTIIGASGLPGAEWCVSEPYKGNVGAFFQLFSNDAGILLCLASLVMIIADVKVLAKGKKMTKWPVLFKLTATSASFFSFLLVYCVVLTRNGFSSSLLFDWRNNLWFNTVTPLLALISFLSVEYDPKIAYGWTVFSSAPIIAYLSIIVPLIDNGSIKQPPYFFLDGANFMRGSIVAWCIGLVLFAQLTATLLFLARKGLRRIILEGGLPASEITLEPKENGDEKYIKILRIVEGSKKPDSPKEGSTEGRIYHVSRHDGGKWQVKLASSIKPIKLFSTQDEAIDFAKGLVKSQGGSIRIHSLAGKIRKE